MDVNWAQFWADFWYQVGISRPHLVGVVFATCVLYLVYALVLDVFGQYVGSSTSTFTLVLATVTGSLLARSMLGNAPTLLGGLVALTTLMLLEWVFGAGRKRSGRHQSRRPGHRRRPPRIVLVEGQMQHDTLASLYLDEDDIDIRLRQMGVRSRSDVALVILESRGSLTVVRKGETIDADLVDDVPGIDAVPDTVVARR